MTLSQIQTLLRDHIATIVADPDEKAATILLDLGHAKPAVENALAKYGYVVGVWPPAAGDGSPNISGEIGVMVRLVVRIEFNPIQLAAQPVPATFCTDFVDSVIRVVLDAVPYDAGGTKFELAADAFELVNFDEGLLAYHIRFTKFIVV